MTVFGMKLPNITLDKIQDEFRALNPNDLGAWPLIPRVTLLCFAFFLLLVAGWWFVWDGELSELSTKEAEEVKLKQQYVEKKRQAVNLDMYTQQLAEIDRSLVLRLSIFRMLP